MKKISILTLISLVAFAFATSVFAMESPTHSKSPTPSPTGALSVKITSFSQIDSTGNIGEVCGVVTVNTTVLPQVGNYIAVTVISDPNHDPGYYTVLASPQGDFCTLIATYTASASATAWLQTDQVKVTSEVVKMGAHR